MNHLAAETSPYLLQHANNPVDWHPWSKEALNIAVAEDKPIFLSIGYSACHWCHVMAHESFEDEQVAALLNKHFVSIKVDREERPDLDRIYMAAVQAMTGSGGWPMSVFLTPDGKPFYGGTYFPPHARYNLPSFTDILLAIADAWRNRRDELIENGEKLIAHIEQGAGMRHSRGPSDPLDRNSLSSASQRLQANHDEVHGGWGTAPKFPQPMALEFLLRYHRSTGDPQALQMVTQTLDAMARGGIYDQLGGGFHRYSVDENWLVPHFEKMLYDNAQLARVYLHAWQVTREPLYRAIVEETLDYVIREMTDPAGGFYSTQDADSEGIEGKFFIWTSDEIQHILGGGADIFMAAYQVTDRGNFEGKNILTYAGTVAERDSLAPARRQLLAAREKRVHPGRDEKVLTSWNGLMLAAFAEAAQALDRNDYRRVAEHNADFMLRELATGDGRLFHTWKAGKARLAGYLEDYTHLVDGLLALYQTTFATRWFVAARELADGMIAHFSAPTGFYDTGDDHEALIVRPQGRQDNAMPSGNAMAAWVLLRLAALSQEPRYARLATSSLRQMQSLAAQHPTGFGQWLIGLDHALSPHREIAILGAPGAADTQGLLAVCEDGYRPHQSLAVGDGSEAHPVALLRGHAQLAGRATAYVCQEYTCLPPVSDPAALADLLI